MTMFFDTFYYTLFWRVCHQISSEPKMFGTTWVCFSLVRCGPNQRQHGIATIEGSSWESQVWAFIFSAGWFLFNTCKCLSVLYNKHDIFNQVSIAWLILIKELFGIMVPITLDFGNGQGQLMDLDIRADPAIYLTRTDRGLLKAL